MSIRQIPRNVIGDLSRPVIESSVPIVREVEPPIVRGISPPVVDVPDTSIEYPTIDIQTEQDFQGVMPTQPPQISTPTPDTRDLPNSSPVVPQETTNTIDMGGMDIPIPDPAPLVAAGSLAVVTTLVTLGSTIALTQIKNALGPYLSRLLKKKKKIKIKQVKPVLHYIPNEDGTVECLEYSAKGVKVLEGGIDKFEQHLRDQVELDGLWEYDNKIIIDEELSEQLTKEGQKRFKKYLAAPKVIAKKLGAKFSF